MLIFVADPPYTVYILHVGMLQLTTQEPSTVGLWSAFRFLATSIYYYYANKRTHIT